MEFSDNRLVFYEPVPSLRDITSFQLALDVWIYKVQQEDSIGDDRSGASFGPGTSRDKDIENPLIRNMTSRETEKITEILYGSVSSLIASKIYHSVQRIIIEIGHWFRYHRKWAIFSTNDIMTRKRLTLIVWRSNAKIDYEKTARNLVSSGALSLFHRFDMFCEYFMEDELRNVLGIWLEMQDKNSRIFMGNSLIRHPTVLYWNSILSTESPNYSADSSIVFLANHTKARLSSSNFTPVKFIFDRTQHPDDRILFGILILKNEEAYDAQKDTIERTQLIRFLISQYTESEQYRLLLKWDLFVKLVYKFALCYEQTRAKKTWQFVMNFVSGDQFFSMLQLVGLSMKDSSYARKVFIDLWHCSPQSLKKFVYQHPESHSFFYKIFIGSDNCARGDNSFLLRNDDGLVEILTGAEPEFRQKFWRCYWSQIANRSQPASLKKIINLCLSKNEIETFESNVKSSDVFRAYFRQLIINGYYSELSEFLEMFVCREKSEIVEFERQLLSGIGDLNSIRKNLGLLGGKIEGFRTFLSELFEGDADGLVEFKIKMILACIPIPLPIPELCDENDLVDTFYFSELLCDKQTLSKAKQAILQKFKALPSNQPENRRRGEWRMLLMWCLGSGKKMFEFRRSLV